MIYKFSPPNEYGLENLRKMQVICRHYGDFNDPFEFRSQLVKGVPDPSQTKRFHAAIAAWGFPDINSAEPHEEYFESLTDGEPAFSLLFDHTRIACFGADRTNLLMWSHYADGLRGFCLGLDETALELTSREYITDVEYLDSPPIVDSFLYVVAEDQFEYHLMAIEERERNEAYFGPDPISENDYRECAEEAFRLMTTIWRHAFAAKPLDWKYERERRLLIRTEQRDNLPIFYHYPQSAIKEIILGERIGPEYRAQILELAAQHYPDAQILSARTVADGYSLTIEATDAAVRFGG